MLPTIPSARILLTSEMAQSTWEDLLESRARAQHICAEATAACVSAAEIKHETAQLRHRARQLRTVHAEHLAVGVRRRHKGRAR